ncbi:MAG: ABC transporter ATP-binding protein [Negativibacillus sp.]
MNPYEEHVKRPFNLKVWKKLWPYIKPYWKLLAVIILFNLGCAFVDIVLPLLQKFAIDNFITAGTTAGIGKFAAVYIGVILLQLLNIMVMGILAGRVEMLIGRDMKRAAFVHLQKLSFSYYNTTPVGFMLARVMSDTGKIGWLFAWCLSDLLWAAAYVLGALGSMLLLDWKMALWVIAVMPFIVLATIYFQKRILHLNRKVRAINSKMTGAFNEGITGARTSKTLVIEDKNDRDFNEITHDMRTTTVAAVRMRSLYVPIVLFMSSISVAIVLTRGGSNVMLGAMQIGTLSAFISYALNIYDPIQQAAGIIADFVSNQANIERITDLLETEPSITDRPDVIEKYGDTFHPKKENWEPIKGDIEFRNVWFRYPDGKEDILQNFNLKVKAGSTVAIVGETGAGKSTLVNLACRFFEPTKGQILIDGVDYRERSQLWLHSNLGYVLQNPHLFSGTIRENIRYGKLDASDEEIEEAARIVSVDSIIRSMEKGYDTDVGEGGDRLSTGEKQLISFARAVLADPRIFVLDEATSSIDTKTEQLIQNAISHLLKNRTSFLIAHRLSTIRQADVILVVRDGKIVEQGTHQELLNKRGYYYTLYQNQYEKEQREQIFRS